MDGRYVRRETTCIQEHERSSRQKSEAERSDVQTVNPEYQSGVSSVVFDPRIVPGTNHKLRSFWAGPYRVSKLIAPSLSEIQPVYYPGEEKLVSLDLLKLYHGEDVVRQEPKDVDPDG